MVIFRNNNSGQPAQKKKVEWIVMLNSLVYNGLSPIGLQSAWANGGVGQAGSLVRLQNYMFSFF